MLSHSSGGLKSESTASGNTAWIEASVGQLWASALPGPVCFCPSFYGSALALRRICPGPRQDTGAESAQPPEVLQLQAAEASCPPGEPQKQACAQQTGAEMSQSLHRQLGDQCLQTALQHSSLMVVRQEWLTNTHAWYRDKQRTVRPAAGHSLFFFFILVTQHGTQDLPWPGIELVPSVLGPWSLNPWTAQEALQCTFRPSVPFV